MSAYDVKSGRLNRSYSISQYCGVSGKFDSFSHTFMPCVGPIVNDSLVTMSRYDETLMRMRRQYMGLPVTLGTYNLKNTPTCQYNMVQLTSTKSFKNVGQEGPFHCQILSFNQTFAS